MKTLVALSALVSLAIAAPALPGDGLETTDHIHDKHLQTQWSLPDSLKRERKSPTDITSTSILNSEIQHIDTGVSTPTARSFGLKKPLIVKKKYGYRLYRDSEEEKANADSSESCGRQVKVKLCDEDGKFRTSVKGSTHESAEIHTSEDDVKHSIKMAKEAVENLQKDLKKMELKSDMKMAHESQTDSELHEDIEVARQALKHIHENFGNLESMSLHATTSRNSEDMHDVHLTIAKTEEERMAQWKEAMENIQKNVEIARNIEDSFKVATKQESLLHLDQSEAASTLTHKIEDNIHLNPSAVSEVNNLRHAEDIVLESHHEDNEPSEETSLNKETQHLSEHNARMQKNIEDDMNTAPSEMIEMHLDNSKNIEALKSENHRIHEHEKSAETILDEENINTDKKDLVHLEDVADHHHHHHQEKSSDLHMDMSKGQSEHHVMQLTSMRTAEGQETKLNDEKDVDSKTGETIDLAPIATSNLISPLTSDANTEHHILAAQKASEDNFEHLEKEKSVGDMTATDDGLIDFLAKSADHLEEDKVEKEHLHRMEQEKAADNSKPEQNELLSDNWDVKPKEAVEIKHFDNIPEQPEQPEHNRFQNLANENIMLAKSADHASIQEHQKQQMVQFEELSSLDSVPQMKAVEEHLHHLQHKHNAHWAHENKHFDHLSSMKAAEEFNKELHMANGQTHGHGIEHSMDHLRNSHLTEHSQIPSKMGLSHNFVQPHPHHPSRFQQNSMHSQMHEMTGMDSVMHSNFHPSMRDAMDGFGSDHMLRWKPVHDSARVAYGSGLSSSIGSTGAVGVFPNANTGGCGIPLLLSCSPSVVSGSLAKAHSGSSYSAPAYRTEDEFGFVNKRDIKKTNDIRTTNSLRLPSIVKQKNSIALENKM